MGGDLQRIAQLAAEIQHIAQNAQCRKHHSDHPRYIEKKALHTTDSIGVTLGVSARRLNRFLIEQDWIYRIGRVYYPTYKIRPYKYCDYQTVEYTGRDGGLYICDHLKWTDRGRDAVIRLWYAVHDRLF